MSPWVLLPSFSLELFLLLHRALPNPDHCFCRRMRECSLFPRAHLWSRLKAQGSRRWTSCSRTAPRSTDPLAYFSKAHWTRGWHLDFVHLEETSRRVASHFEAVFILHLYHRTRALFPNSNYHQYDLFFGASYIPIWTEWSHCSCPDESLHRCDFRSVSRVSHSFIGAFKAPLFVLTSTRARLVKF